MCVSLRTLGVEGVSFLPSGLAVCLKIFKRAPALILMIPFLGIYPKETVESAVRDSYASSLTATLFIKGNIRRPLEHSLPGNESFPGRVQWGLGNGSGDA